MKKEKRNNEYMLKIVDRLVNGKEVQLTASLMINYIDGRLMKQFFSGWLRQTTLEK